MGVHKHPHAIGRLVKIQATWRYLAFICVHGKDSLCLSVAEAKRHGDLKGLLSQRRKKETDFERNNKLKKTRKGQGARDEPLSVSENLDEIPLRTTWI